MWMFFMCYFFLICHESFTTQITFDECVWWYGILICLSFLCHSFKKITLESLNSSMSGLYVIIFVTLCCKCLVTNITDLIFTNFLVNGFYIVFEIPSWNRLMCLVWLLCVANVLLQRLHLGAFSPVCFIVCDFKLGANPSCTYLMCRSLRRDIGNVFSHIGHLDIFSCLWVTVCSFKLLLSYAP